MKPRCRSGLVGSMPSLILSGRPSRRRASNSGIVSTCSNPSSRYAASAKCGCTDILSLQFDDGHATIPLVLVAVAHALDAGVVAEKLLQAAPEHAGALAVDQAQVAAAAEHRIVEPAFDQRLGVDEALSAHVQLGHRAGRGLQARAAPVAARPRLLDARSAQTPQIALGHDRLERAERDQRALAVILGQDAFLIVRDD